MNYFSCIAIFIFGWNVHVSAQDTFEVKLKYKPNHIYKHQLEQKSETEIKYEGDSLFFRNLAEKKIKDHSKTSSEQLIQTQMETSEINPDSFFRVKIEFVKTMDESGKTVVPEGSKLFGKCRFGKLPIMDSVSINGILKIKTSIFELYETTFPNIEYPKNKLKIGESFYNTLPLTIPIENSEPVRVTLISGYRLVKVETGLAFFEVKQVYKITLAKSKFHPEISGEGRGNLVFDLSNNYFKKYELNSKLTYVVKQKNNKVTATTNSRIVQSSTIIVVGKGQIKY